MLYWKFMQYNVNDEKLFYNLCWEQVSWKNFHMIKKVMKDILWIDVEVFSLYKHYKNYSFLRKSEKSKFKIYTGSIDKLNV